MGVHGLGGARGEEILLLHHHHGTELHKEYSLRTVLEGPFFPFSC